VEIVAGNAEGGMVSVTIRDHGPGGPYQKPAWSIYLTIYRVPGSKSGGTGLGLAIARAFVEAHGGILNASNHPEGGLSVSIIFKTEN